MAWKTLRSESKYKNRWMEITEDQVETDHGHRLTYGVVRKEPCALIVPWDGTHVYLVGQYRYPVNEFSWEFPQGHFEHDSILSTARHELREETGLSAASMREVSSFNLAPGHHSQRCHIFLATDLAQGRPRPEASEEGMVVKKVTVAGLRDLIARGEITDGPTLTAYGVMTAKRILTDEKVGSG